mmetsp:Transcript_17698/g.24872  ORF Transcript_17698/g.24872 Transcript_17698/m.24872 type:complete len:317 (-) Transcript_17698:858-1808(-)
MRVMQQVAGTHFGLNFRNHLCQLCLVVMFDFQISLFVLETVFHELVLVMCSVGGQKFEDRRLFVSLCLDVVKFSLRLLQVLFENSIVLINCVVHFSTFCFHNDVMIFVELSQLFCGFFLDCSVFRFALFLGFRQSLGNFLLKRRKLVFLNHLHSEKSVTSSFFGGSVVGLVLSHEFVELSFGSFDHGSNTEEADVPGALDNVVQKVFNALGVRFRMFLNTNKQGSNIVLAGKQAELGFSVLDAGSQFSLSLLQFGKDFSLRLGNLFVHVFEVLDVSLRMVRLGQASLVLGFELVKFCLDHFRASFEFPFKACLDFL